MRADWWDAPLALRDLSKAIWAACHSYVIRMSLVCTRVSFVSHSYVLVCHPCVTRMYSYVIRISLICYSYVIRMSLVCTCMSFVCHWYILVCHSYVTGIYWYVIRMSLVCTCMTSVCHSYILVWYSYVIGMSLVCTCMSFVYHSSILVYHLYLTRMCSYAIRIHSSVVLPWTFHSMQSMKNNKTLGGGSLIKLVLRNFLGWTKKSFYGKS